MKAKLERFARSLGAAGVLGVGVLFACLGFYLSALEPARLELKEKSEAVQRMHARRPHRPVSAVGPAEELARFYGFFPATAALTDHVERLHRLGRRAGLEIAQGEYRLEKPAAGLWLYRVNLPVRGTYPQVRDFAAAVLREQPAASLDALRFERKRALDAELDAQLRLTFYLRPAGEMP